MNGIRTSPLALRHSFAATLADDLASPDIAQVLTAFAHDLDRLTGVLATAGDAATFHRAAHALSGAAGAACAMRLAQLCRDADPADLPAMLREAGSVRGELDRVLAWLASHDA